MPRLLVIAGILTAVLLTIGCIDMDSGQQPAGKLAVVNHSLTEGEAGSAEVQLTVKNVGSVVVELAQVTVSFYDADKNLIDSSSDSVLNLGPDETWDFKIACQGTRCRQVRSYEIETMAGTSSGGL